MVNDGQATLPGNAPLPLPGREEKQIPGRIGPFRILGLLASGMALVYHAEQDSPRRRVALKIPRGGKLLTRESRDRFLREVQLAASLDHAGIVPVLDAGEIDGMPYYTMPWVEGRTFDDYIRAAAPGVDEKLKLFLRLCSVVEALHARHLIHRDLKPANVLVDQHGDIRLLDFGLARALQDEAGISSDQAIMGTLQYMAPEQTRMDSTATITTATDVYALGVMLYVLLTDGMPYRVDGPRDAAMVIIREQVIRPPSESTACDTVPAGLDTVVLKALEKDPRRRFQTAGELARAIQDVERNGRGAEAESAPSRGARDAMLMGIILAVVILVLAWIFALLQRSSRPPLPRKIPPALQHNR